MYHILVYASKSKLKNNLQVAIDPKRLNGVVIAKMEMPFYPAGTKVDTGFTLQPTVGLPNHWTIDGEDWFGLLPVDFVSVLSESATSRSHNRGESDDSLRSDLIMSESLENIYRPELGDKMEIYPYKPSSTMLHRYQGCGSMFNEGGLGLPAGTPVLRYVIKRSGERIPYNPETRHAHSIGL